MKNKKNIKQNIQHPSGFARIAKAKDELEQIRNCFEIAANALLKAAIGCANLGFDRTRIEILDTTQDILNAIKKIDERDTAREVKR